LALLTVLYGWETWAIREQDKSRLTSAEMKFMRRRVKKTLQDYKTTKIFCQNLKLTQLQRKFKNTETNGYTFGEWTEIDFLPHLIMKYQPRGKRSQGRPLESLLGC
jgi:hypothetical protein